MVESRPQVMNNRTPFCHVLNWFNRKAAAEAEAAAKLEASGKDATAEWAGACDTAATASKLDAAMEEYLAAFTDAAEAIRDPYYADPNKKSPYPFFTSDGYGRLFLSPPDTEPTVDGLPLVAKVIKNEPFGDAAALLERIAKPHKGEK